MSWRRLVAVLGVLGLLALAYTETHYSATKVDEMDGTIVRFTIISKARMLPPMYSENGYALMVKPSNDMTTVRFFRGKTRPFEIIARTGTPEYGIVARKNVDDLIVAKYRAHAADGFWQILDN